MNRGNIAVINKEKQLSHMKFRQIKVSFNWYLDSLENSSI